MRARNSKSPRHATLVFADSSNSDAVSAGHVANGCDKHAEKSRGITGYAMEGNAAQLGSCTKVEHRNAWIESVTVVKSLAWRSMLG